MDNSLKAAMEGQRKEGALRDVTRGKNKCKSKQKRREMHPNTNETKAKHEQRKGKTLSKIMEKQRKTEESDKGRSRGQ